MKTYRVVQTHEYHVAHRICDRCKTEGATEGPQVHTITIDGDYGGAFDCAVLTFELCDRCVAALMLSLVEAPDLERGENVPREHVEETAGNLRVIWAEHTQKPISSRAGRNPYAHADDPPRLPDRDAALIAEYEEQCAAEPEVLPPPGFLSALHCDHANESPRGTCGCGDNCYCRSPEGTCR